MTAVRSSLPSSRRPVRYVLLLLLVSVSALACGTRQSRNADDDSPLFLTTTPPLHAIVAEVTEKHARVEPLLAGGASPHAHDPRPSNARSAARSTALFYGAPSLDAWAADLDAPAVVAMLSLVPDSVRLRLPGEEATDPHFWLDPLAVAALLPTLADTLCTFDDAGCNAYRSRARSFGDDLGRLNEELERQMAPLRGEAIVLSHPFLHYFARRYGIEVTAVIETSAGGEPSPRAVQRLIKQARLAGVRAVVSMPQHRSRAADAVAEGAGIPMVELDPIGGEPGRSGYAELLRYNARQLVEALR